MREKPYCSISLIVMADKAISPTNGLTPSRFTISLEPIQVFDYRNKEDFLAALKSAIERGFPNVPDPPEEDLIYFADGMPGFKSPPELKYAPASSWDDLERRSISVSIRCYPSQYLIESWGRAADQKWSEDKTLELRLPASVGLEVVIDAILDHLRIRKDLPGLVVDFSQQKTA
jgi:hypothetical protein